MSETFTETYVLVDRDGWFISLGVATPHLLTSTFFSDVILADRHRKDLGRQDLRIATVRMEIVAVEVGCYEFKTK